jgi:hypothetical protein
LALLLVLSSKSRSSLGLLSQLLQEQIFAGIIVNNALEIVIVIVILRMSEKKIKSKAEIMVKKVIKNSDKLYEPLFQS